MASKAGSFITTGRNWLSTKVIQNMPITALSTLIGSLAWVATSEAKVSAYAPVNQSPVI